MTNYSSANFKVSIDQKTDRVLLTQEVGNSALYTGELPGTIEVLKRRLPTIFKNQCENGKCFSFRKEAENTEVGHLFEHLILEYLKLLVEKNGIADFRGETSWDWTKQKKGSFNIVVYSDLGYKNIFPTAFKNAVRVMEEIFAHGKERGVPALC